MQYVDVVPVLLVALAALLLAGAVAVTPVVTLGPVETSGPAEASLTLVPLRDIRQALRSGNAHLAVLNLGGQRGAVRTGRSAARAPAA